MTVFHIHESEPDLVSEDAGGDEALDDSFDLGVRRCLVISTDAEAAIWCLTS